jgi:hypothetical protein
MMAAVMQVAVSPLFPVSAAVPDVALVTLVMLAVFAGPTTVMAGLPLMALFIGFDSGRQPGLVLMAYLPLLPIALFLEESRVPLNRFLQMSLAGVVTGAWARTMMAFGAIAGGAEPALGVLGGQLVLPGMVLDFALLALVYAPVRLLGWSGRGMRLQRSRW